MDHETLQYTLQQLRLAAAFHAAGKLDSFIAATGETLYCSENFIWQSFYDIIGAMGDLADIRYDDENCETRLYLSDENIRTYFSFVREHAKKLDIPMKEDPYYQNARDYFETTMLDCCPYCCWFRLVTQIHHKYGFGLSIWIHDEQFEDNEELLYGLLDVLVFFRDSAEHLQTQGEVVESGIILPFRTPEKEAA